MLTIEDYLELKDWQFKLYLSKGVHEENSFGLAADNLCRSTSAKLLENCLLLLESWLHPANLISRQSRWSAQKAESDPSFQYMDEMRSGFE